MTITPEERDAIRKIAEDTQQLNWIDNIHDKLTRLLDSLFHQPKPGAEG